MHNEIPRRDAGLKELTFIREDLCGHCKQFRDEKMLSVYGRVQPLLMYYHEVLYFARFARQAMTEVRS